MAPQPVLDAETEALIAQLVVDSFEHFANGTLTRAWDPSVGPSRIGLSYHDYEEPLSSYERQVLEGADTPDLDEGWIVTEVCTTMLYQWDAGMPMSGFMSKNRYQSIFLAGVLMLNFLSCMRRMKLTSTITDGRPRYHNSGALATISAQPGPG